MEQRWHHARQLMNTGCCCGGKLKGGGCGTRKAAGRSELTKDDNDRYTKGEPIRCDCGKIIAFKKDGKLWLYCKKCKREIPIEPEP